MSVRIHILDLKINSLDEWFKSLISVGIDVILMTLFNEANRLNSG